MFAPVAFAFDIMTMRATLLPETTANTAGVLEILESWIRTQIGEGDDKQAPREAVVYHITIAVDLTEDSFVIKHDCGNEALALGIALSTLRQFTLSVSPELEIQGEDL